MLSRFQSITGDFVDIDISDEKLIPFDVRYNQTVTTDCGSGNVIGICNNGRLWVMLFNDSGLVRDFNPHAIVLPSSRQQSIFQVNFISVRSKELTTQRLKEKLENLVVDQNITCIVKQDEKTEDKGELSENKSEIENKNTHSTSKLLDFLKNRKSSFKPDANHAFNFRLKTISSMKVVRDLADQKITAESNSIQVLVNLNPHNITAYSPIKSLLDKYNVELILPSIQNLEECKELFFYSDNSNYRNKTNRMINTVSMNGINTFESKYGYVITYFLFALRHKNDKRMLACTHFNDQGKIESIVVSKDAQSQHFGTLLLLATIKFLEKRLNKEKCITLISSYAAAPVYVKMGFEPNYEDVDYDTLVSSKIVDEEELNCLKNWDSLSVEEKIYFYTTPAPYNMGGLTMKLDLQKESIQNLFTNKIKMLDLAMPMQPLETKTSLNPFEIIQRSIPSLVKFTKRKSENEDAVSNKSAKINTLTDVSPVLLFSKNNPTNKDLNNNNKAESQNRDFTARL